MPNVHDDDCESLLFADESEWMDDERDYAEEDYWRRFLADEYADEDD